MTFSVPNAQREMRALYKVEPGAAMVTDHGPGQRPSAFAVPWPLGGTGLQVYT